MKEENFCKLFFYALLNLISFLFSIVFLTSIYNIGDESYFLNCSEIRNINKKYNNHYKGISTLFSFSLISFLIFVIALIILIKRDKMDSENEYNYNNYNNNIHIEINQININLNNNVVNLESARVIGYNNNNQNNLKEEEDTIITQNRGVMNTIIISFTFCQILYVIELFVLSSFHHKSKNYEKEYKCENIKELTKIYSHLLIFGYIFLCIYVVFYIYLLILHNKFGDNAKNRLDKFTKSQYCECCNNCIVKVCEKCTDFFRNKTDEELENDNKINIEKLQQSNEQKLEYIRQLQDYKKKLENLNINYISNGSIDDNELKSLNLYRLKSYN